MFLYCRKNYLENGGIVQWLIHIDELIEII